MTEAEWDAVIRVHLKGHAAPTSHATAYWRSRSKAGREVRAAIVHTTSIAAFGGNFGQANYTAAKSAIIGLSRVAALEGARYGIRSNAVSPSARTRLGVRARAPRRHSARPPTRARSTASIRRTSRRSSPGSSRPIALRTPRSSTSTAIGCASCRCRPSSHEITTSGRWTPEALDEQLPSRLVRAPELGDPSTCIRRLVSAGMDFDLAQLGRWTDDREFVVTPEATIAYAAATNDALPGHLERRGRPADVRRRSRSMGVATDAMDRIWVSKLAGDYDTRSLHGEQSLAVHEPIVPGMSSAPVPRRSVSSASRRGR